MFCREMNRWKNVDSLDKKKKVDFCPVCFDNDMVPLQTRQNLLECQDDSLKLQHLCVRHPMSDLTAVELRAFMDSKPTCWGVICED